jgi:tetratricopeptide (TPR) repeat protein
MDDRRRTRCVVILCLLSGVAHADDVEEARRHYRSGSSAYELGQFDEAIREYTAAYKLKSDPAILYNLGQANRLANHPSEALHFYKMYLSKEPDASNRDEVRTKIEALLELVEQQRKTQALPPDQPIREATAPSTPPVPVAAAAPLPAPAKSERPIYKRGWFWGAIGGVVAVAVGVGHGVGLGLRSHAPSATEGGVRF